MQITKDLFGSVAQTFTVSACLFTGLITAHSQTLPARPVWLSEMSLTLKESYDDNLYLSGVNPKLFPSSYVVPNGSVAALRNRSSFVTTVSPKIVLNLAPLFGEDAFLKSLSFGYAPEFAIYHDASSESYDAHRFITSLKGNAGDFSLSAENCFTYVDGSKFGPTYPGALYNALMNAAPRERREQIQDRAAVSLRYGRENWFVRPVASLAYYDLMTAQLNVTGYQSYVDRYDANGGFDIGGKILQDTYLTLGYRYGYQFQQKFAYSPYSSPNDYHRLLAGIEGKPWHWLDVKIQGGPDFRLYEEDSATRITPVNDHSPVKYYVDAALAATVSARDTVTFKCKDWEWVSSIGKVPYLDSSYELGEHHVINKHLSMDVSGRVATMDFTAADLSTCHRDDAQYTVNAGATYAINTHASVAVNYSHDFGRNLEDGIATPKTRDFEHNLISLAGTFRF